MCLVLCGGNAWPAWIALDIAKNIRAEMDQMSPRLTPGQLVCCGVASNPGFCGGSRGTWSDNVRDTMEQHLAQVHTTLTENYKDHKFLLVGTSLGGYAAAVLARMLSTTPGHCVISYVAHNTFTSGWHLLATHTAHVVTTACLGFDYGFDTLQELEAAVTKDDKICLSCTCTALQNNRRLGKWLQSGDMVVPCAASYKLRQWIDKRTRECCAPQEGRTKVFELPREVGGIFAHNTFSERDEFQGLPYANARAEVYAYISGRLLRDVTEYVGCRAPPLTPRR